MSHRLLLDGGAQPLGDLVAYNIERHLRARDTLVDHHDMESITGLNQLAQQSGRSETKQSLFEFRKRLASADLSLIDGPEAFAASSARQQRENV